MFVWSTVYHGFDHGSSLAKQIDHAVYINGVISNPAEGRTMYMSTKQLSPTKSTNTVGLDSNTYISQYFT